MNDGAIKTIYEDNDLIVIEKPSGLITHQKNIDDTQPSVASWIIDNYPNLKEIGEPFIASGVEVSRAGILHRLDKDTSGLILVAKNNKSFFYLKDLFQTRKIRKYYMALVHGRPKRLRGTINTPLGRIGMKRTTKIIGTKLIDKKEALTDYKVLQAFDDFSLLELIPQTGRTHQLRVHLNSIGHPIVNDPVYGSKKLNTPKGVNRLFLHAYKLEFIAPDGKALAIETELPKELQKLLNMLK